jgi:mannose/fructose/N-acetylgalactosamine-specific phosphotransferase system component IIC
MLLYIPKLYKNDSIYSFKHIVCMIVQYLMVALFIVFFFYFTMNVVRHILVQWAPKHLINGFINCIPFMVS